ncbi:unnamed protein product, partial [Rotaria sp. Silwood2]
EALTSKYAKIHLDLPWIKQVKCTNTPVLINQSDLSTNDDDEPLADYDFKLEMLA